MENVGKSDKQGVSGNARWFITLLLLLLGVLVWLDRPLVRGDGIAYLAWVDSFVLDGDIDFENQAERLAPVLTYQLQWHEGQGRLTNIFPFGTVVFQAPFYRLGHFFAVRGWWDAEADYFHQMQGIWRPYSLWLMVGANVMALGMATIGWKMARLFAKPRDAALTVLLMMIGTPIIYYVTVSPLNSHNAGALAALIFVWGLLKVTGRVSAETMVGKVSTRWWLLVGVSAGVMVLSRWQLALIVPTALFLFERRHWRGWLTAAASGTLALLPLPIVWYELFGQAFVLPYNEVSGSGGFLSFPGNTLAVLWQTIYHSPALILVLPGLWLLWRQDKRLALFSISAIALQLWLNGGVLDWWAGETFGMRRMSELLPFYFLAVAALAGGLRGKWMWLLRLILIFLLIYALAYIIIFINYTWTNNDGVFIDTPLIMWRHFWQQPDRWAVTRAVFRAHVGPYAWRMPGP